MGDYCELCKDSGIMVVITDEDKHYAPCSVCGGVFENQPDQEGDTDNGNV